MYVMFMYVMFMYGRVSLCTLHLCVLQVCPYKNPRGLVYPWRSTDQEEEDVAKGLLPTGWRRVGGEPLYPGLSDPLFPGAGASIQDDITALREQIDILTRRLDKE